MGLFSFLNKNKQDTTGKDSGFYSADDQARSKRASHAGAPAAAKRGNKEAADPVLPEKKRARRRLVGAVALALGVAIGLPMLLDSEPKPLGADIAIQIPAKDKPAAAERGASASTSKVAASAALDQSEEIVTLPLKSASKAPPAEPEAPPAAPKAEPKPDANPVAQTKPAAETKPAAKPVDAKPTEARHDAKLAETKAAEAKHEVKTLELKAEAKREAKAAEPQKASGDAARAQAILEGKPATPAPAAASGKYVVQVAALASQEKIDELQGKLKEAGIKFYTQKVPTQAGDRTRIRVGPFDSKEEAEKMRAKLVKAGLGGSLVPA
jgi:DedD protein